MEDVMQYLNENQMLFYVIGVCIVLAIIIILSMKLFSHKETPITDKELNKKKEELLDKLNGKEDTLEKNTTNVQPIHSDEIKKEEPKEEIEVLNLEDSKMEQLDSLLETMQKDLEKGSKHTPESFEAFQEENAIISYEELKKAAEKQEIEDDENIPVIMSVHELEARNKKPEEPVKQDIIEPAKEESIKKFKNTDFISPIYGKINTNLDYPKIHSFKEKTASEVIQDHIEEHSSEEKSIYVTELEKEQKQNEEFLQALKEFRQDL